MIQIQNQKIHICYIQIQILHHHVKWNIQKLGILFLVVIQRKY